MVLDQYTYRRRICNVSEVTVRNCKVVFILTAPIERSGSSEWFRINDSNNDNVSEDCKIESEHDRDSEMFVTEYTELIMEWIRTELMYMVKIGKGGESQKLIKVPTLLKWFL